jgi:hypothetical protein
MLAGDSFPVAMIMKRVEKPTAKFRCLLQRQDNLNVHGWKLGHIIEVGLAGRTPIEDVPLVRLIEHFTRSMSPSNMFLVPLPWAGLAESTAFAQAMTEKDGATPDATSGSAGATSTTC